MVDPTEHELTAMSAASDLAGQFIESINETDMAKWTSEQWGQFIEVICGGYVESLCAQQAMINDSLTKARVG
jgi:hypothetical protein